MGRPPKTPSPELLADRAAAQQSHNSMSGPFGIKWQSVVAGVFAQDCCNFYNEALKANSLPVFRYLIDGLVTLTGSKGIPEHERCESTVRWLSGDHRHATGGEITLWGRSVPVPVLSAVSPPKDGSPHRLPFFPLAAVFEKLRTPAQRAKFEQDYLPLITVRNGNATETLKRITAGVVVPARSKPGKFVAGLGPDRDESGRRSLGVEFIGKSEAREMRAIAHVASITTAVAIYLLQHSKRSVGAVLVPDQPGKPDDQVAGTISSLYGFHTQGWLTRDEADAKYWYILDGFVKAQTQASIDAKEATKPRFDCFEDWLIGTAGEAAANHYLGEMVCGLGLARRHSRLIGRPLGADFYATCHLGAYLWTRFRANCLVFHGGGTIRLCQRPGCPAPLFVYRPPKVVGKNGKPLRYKPEEAQWCPNCRANFDYASTSSAMAREKQRRYDQKRRSRPQEN